MDEKVKGILAYFGWIGGLIVLFGLKDNSQRTKFNACQSIVISVIGMLAGFLLGFIPVIRYFGFIISGATFVLLVVGMLKAYQEEDYEIPVISDLTRDLFKSKLGE